MTGTAERKTRGQRLGQGPELLGRLVQFCQVQGKGRVYSEWPVATIAQYLTWHASLGTLAWAIMPSGEVAGVGVVYPCDEVELRAAHAAGESTGCFARPDWSRDSVYLADFVVTEPGVLGCLLREFWHRFPEGQDKKWFCHRMGKLVQLNGTKYVGVLRKAICGKY